MNFICDAIFITLFQSLEIHVLYTMHFEKNRRKGADDNFATDVTQGKKLSYGAISYIYSTFLIKIVKYLEQIFSCKYAV